MDDDAIGYLAEKGGGKKMQAIIANAIARRRKILTIGSYVTWGTGSGVGAGEI